MSDDNVLKLPVKFKPAKPENRTLLLAHETTQENHCTHSPLFGCSYVIDERLAEVECSKCAAKLSPMWALQALAKEERRLNEKREIYQEEQKRLAQRRRTKCEHCDRMTRISRR